MCGVAAIFGYHYAAMPAERNELRCIRDHMSARGPDGHGEWFSDDGRVALGHQRLSIIDLSEGGAQPMRSADGRLVISFNGEIYNYRELRTSLEAQGCVFASASDTEVLIHLYARKGPAMLKDLRGMFALALYDADRAALLLARDTFGIKPLYYADDGWTVRAASQVKALLASPRVSRAPEPAGIAGFYLFGSVPEPFTLYQEIRSVPAGSYVWVDSTGPSPPATFESVAQLWAASMPRMVPEAEMQALARDAFLDSVRHHLVSDVEVGLFLSAGVDSSALLGLMRDAGQGNVRAITLAFREFEGTPRDELPLAREAASRHHARHSVRFVDQAEFNEDMPRLLESMDQPSIDGVNTWFVSKAAQEAGLKVALSGVGADEVLGGYPSFRDIPRWARFMWLPSRVPGLGLAFEAACAAFRPLRPRMTPKLAGVVRHGGSFAGAWLLRRGLYLPSELPGLLGLDLAREGLSRLNPLTLIASTLHPDPATSFGRVATLEASLYMRNQLLRDTDWASMAHSLEVRTPFVDVPLVRALAPAMARAPAGAGKKVLGRSASTPVPETVLRRPKTGFTTPVALWQQQMQRPGAPVGKASEPGESAWARNWAGRVLPE